MEQRIKMSLDRESEELERAYPGILARLDVEPLDRLAREYRLPKGALYQARDRLRRLRAVAPVARPEPRVVAPEPQPAAPPTSKDPALQYGLERAYPGITNALSRRDDVEVAVQFGISLQAIARIREVLGVERVEVARNAPEPSRSTARALPTRLVASSD